MREEDNTDHHDEDAADHLCHRDGIQVTVANCRQRRQGKVTWNNHLGVSIFNLIDAEHLQEGVARLDVLGRVLRAYNIVPDAADGERDDDGDDDESDDLETVHENVLSDDPVLALRVLKCLLKYSVHFALVH